MNTEPKTDPAPELTFDPASDEPHVHGPDCAHGHHHHLDAQAPFVRPQAKVGRNDPCPCGSGNKFKKCCAKG